MTPSAFFAHERDAQADIGFDERTLTIGDEKMVGAQWRLEMLPGREGEHGAEDASERLPTGLRVRL
jgi:hypothetical protein